MSSSSSSSSSSSGGLLLLGVGQAGVSLCGALLDALQWRRCGVVLVDGEAKAVRSALRRHACLAACEPRIVSASGNGGNGNSFARGYASGDDALGTLVLDAVRTTMMVVRCVLVLGSGGGGTGSGLGAWLTERLRERVASSVLVVNAVVWPMSRGEVSVQSYNAALLLQVLTQESDGVIVCYNDEAYESCVSLLGIKSPSLHDMNIIIARRLAHVATAAASEPKSWFGIVSHMFAHAGYRLSCIRRLPEVGAASKAFTTASWSYLCKHLLQMQRSGAAMEFSIDWRMSPDSPSNNRALALTLSLRGPDASAAVVDAFDDRRLYTRWNLDPLLVLRESASLADVGFERSAACWSVCSSLHSPLDLMTAKATKLLHAKAYVHQYQPFGIDESDIRSAILCMEQLCTSYSQL